ncbi:MAG: LysM peptidoglycan-binding domain-containing protein [Eubacterium sp.]
MIEVVYNGTESSQQTNIEVKTPKNVRQVGEPSGSRKIYVENDVMEYLKKASETNEVKYGILLGTIKRSEGISYIFVKALAKAEVIENSIIFNDEIWAGIYRDVRKYFDGMEIIGWYVSVKYRVKEDLAAIKKIHMDNFAGVDRICYLRDRAEHEEGFYVYENGNMNRQRGYFTYFERNQELQKYFEEREGEKENNIMSDLRKNLNKEEKTQGTVKKFKGRIPEAIIGAGKESDNQTKETNADAVMRKSARETDVNSDNKDIKANIEKTPSYMKYMQPMAAVLTIALVFSTIVMMSNYSELKNIKETLGELSSESVNSVAANVMVTSKDATADDPNPDDEEVSNDISVQDNTLDNEESQNNIQEDDMQDSNTQEAESDKDGTFDNVYSEDTTDTVDNIEMTTSTEENSGTANTISDGTASGNISQYHTVKAGETLYEISVTYYGSGNMVSAIQELNDIDDNYSIYEGQTLVLP